MKDQEKSNRYCCGVDMINVEKWKQILNACVATKLKPWNTVNYMIWDTLTHAVTQIVKICL